MAKEGKPVTRMAVRDAIQTTRLDTLQGPVSFDENGDMTSKAVSIYQVQYGLSIRSEDVVHQFQYVGVAPEM